MTPKYIDMSLKAFRILLEKEKKDGNFDNVEYIEGCIGDLEFKISHKLY